MEQEQMREEFEQWYTSYDVRTPTDPFEKEVAWAAWKASREHLVVDLPSTSSYASYEVFYYCSDVQCALEEQGIKYK